MGRVAQGDAKAYRQVVDTHLNRIVAFAGRLLGSRDEAEEVAQETFLRAWQRAQTYEPKAKLSTWLHTIAHNLAIDRLRKRHETSSTDLIDEAPASGRPSTYLEEKRTVQTIQAALDKLPPRQKVAITLVHYQGLSNPEAAQVMEVGVDALESLLSRARRQLKSELRELNTGDRDPPDAIRPVQVGNDPKGTAP